MLIPAIFAYVADITTMDQRAKGNSLISAAMSLGIMIGPGIGSFLSEFGLKVPLLISAFVGVFAVIFSAFLLEESKDSKMEVLNEVSESMVAEVIQSFHKPYLMPLIIFLASSILRPVLTTLISKLAGNEQGFAMEMNNSYMSIGNILGPLLAGILFDVKMNYPFMLGCTVLLITTILSNRWQSPEKNG